MKRNLFLLCTVFVLSHLCTSAQHMKQVIKQMGKPNGVQHQFASITASCSADTILLTTQVQIDNFSADYPTCTVPKYLLIDGAGASPAITNLDGLSSITGVEKKLMVQNTSLTSLSGLSGLTAIGDSLQVQYNPLMTEIGLYNLTQLGTLYLLNLPQLTSIDGLSDHITRIDGDVRIDSVALTNLNGLSHIVEIQNGLSINHTPVPDLSSLTDLTRLINGYVYLDADEALTRIDIPHLEQTWGFLFSNLPNLTSIAGLTDHLINTDIGTFWFMNTGLTDLTGMENVTNAANFYLWVNSNLTSLHGLENLHNNIGGGISIWGNYNLTDLTALENVTSISDGTLEIGDVSGNSLHGIHNITTIGKGLWIHNNPDITNLNDLNTNLQILNHDNNDSLRINDNWNLAVCSSTPICNYLNVDGRAFIDGNATGCATYNEVAATCTGTVCANPDEKTWNGSEDNDWNNGNNWTPSGVPGICTKVTIPYSGSLNWTPMANSDIYIGGLVMESGSELDLNFYNLTTTKTLLLDNAGIYYGGNIVAKRVHGPKVHGNYIEGSFTCEDYGGQGEFFFNSFYGNTVLSDSIGRNEGTSAIINNFNGDLLYVNNSDYGQNYLSNASPGFDYIMGNLTVVNNSNAGISVGLGGDNPIHIDGDLIVRSTGNVDFNTITFTGSGPSHIIQDGPQPISINNLYMWKYGSLTLEQDVHVNNYLDLGAFCGEIITDENKVLVLNNGATVQQGYSSGFITGPLKKIGNQAFTFPVGSIENNTAWKAPISITTPSLPDDEFTARYFHHSPNNDGYDTSHYTPGFGGIQSRGYWKLNRDNGNARVKVTLAYDSTISGPSYLYQYMQVAGWNGSQWRSWGSGGFAGQIYGGTLVSGDSLDQFGPVAFSFKPVRKPVITMSNLDTIHCQYNRFYVPFTLDTAMISGNNFILQLSDTFGNFSANPPFIGSVTSINSDSILSLYPTYITYGKQYKIRVVGSLPPDTSINTRTIVFMRPPQQSFDITGPNPACVGGGVQKYYPSLHEDSTKYTWSLSGGGTFTTNGDTAYVTWNSAGNYNLTLQSSNGCGNGPQKIITVTVRPPAPTATPTINNIGRWLYASSAPANAGYQWYRNGGTIPGATNTSYYASLGGSYTARFANSCGEGPASNSISFAADAVAQTINFPPIPDKNYGDAPFVPVATATSGLPVAFTLVSGPATINTQTNTITIIGTGVVTITANQSGDNIYDTAAPVTRSFTVNKAAQTITFNTIPDQDFTNPPVSLGATSSSGLAVSYSIVSGPATISGNQVTLTGLGTVTVRAMQAGDNNYLAATPVDRSFCVNIAKLNPIAGYNNLCPGNATYTVNNIPGATYFWRIAGGATLPSTTSSASINWVTPGVYTLLVSASGSCGAASMNDTLVVNVINSIQPDSVHGMLPADGAINQQLPLNLSWIPAQPNLFYTFDLYLWPADQSQPSTPYAAGLTAVNYTIPLNAGLTYNQPYKWMIAAHNGSCTIIHTGPVQQFTLIPLPDLITSNVQAPTSAFSGQTITINWTVSNPGPGRTTTNQSWTDAVFLSFDDHPVFSIPPATNPAAWSILDFPVKPLLVGTKPNVSALDPGQQYSNSINFTLPVNYNLPLYAYVITNYPAGSNAPVQVTVVNDTARAPQAIAVTLSPTPDLRVDTVFTPSSTFSGSTINITYKVKNYGVLTPSGASWTDKVYISQSPIFNINNAILLKYPKFNDTYYANAVDAVVSNSTQLLQDSSYTKNVQVVVPNYIFGSYFIYVVTNSGNTVYEGALSNNNTNQNQLQVFLTPTPHLTVSSLTVPVTSASITQPIGVNWNISNAGFNDNIEKNKGHYFVFNGSCFIDPPPCILPPNCNNCICPPPPPPTPGLSFRDSTSFGSSYWIDKVYLSTNGAGLDVNNAVLVTQVNQGTQNSGLNIPDNYTNPSAAGCKNLGTDGSMFNANTDNVIRPGSNHPKTGNFIIPDNLPGGDYYVYVFTNSTKTVYEYPGTPEIRRSTLPITIQRPDATVSQVAVPANTSGGQQFTIDYTILNNGPGAVFNHLRNDKIYVSTSPVFDGSAQLISTQTFTENLPVGTGVSHSLSYTFAPSTSGVRYFYVHTNYDSAFRETNPNNNISAAAMTTVSAGTPTDLYVAAVQLGDTVYTTRPRQLKYNVVNNGPGTASGTWIDSIFISCNPVFNQATAYYVDRKSHNGTLATGGSYADSFNIILPYAYLINNCFPQTAYNTAYFFVKANADGAVYEGSNGNNNIAATGSRILNNPFVDHIVTTVSGADTATVGRPYTAGWTVKNIGYVPGSSYYYYYNSWADAIYFSPDSVFNSNAVRADYYPETTPVDHNQSYSESKNLTTPNLPTGDYYVLAATNIFAGIAGENNANNYNAIRDGAGAAKKIHIVQPVLPDLTDSLLAVPSSVATGQPLTLVHRVTNKGAGVTYPSSWSDDVWLSSDFIAGNSGDILLSAKNHAGALQPAQYYNDTVTANISLNLNPGNYVLISRTNVQGNVFETDASNNLAFGYITVYKPAPVDLIVEHITTPDTVYLGYTVDTAKWVVKNISPNTASGVSSDGIYLSKGTVLDSAAVLLGIKAKTINMAPLTGDTIRFAPLVNNVTEGSYNVIVKTDLLNNIVETDKNNNTAVAATPIYIGVKELPMNVLVSNTLQSISRFYKLVIPDSLNGATILVTLKSNDSLSMKNQLFIGKGYIPSAANFDYTYSTPNYGNQDIVMASVTSGTYYITIRCVSLNPVVQDITLKAVKLPFAILNVQSSSGGNIGNVTVKISGSLFAPNMTARISKPGTVITASTVYFINSTSVYATFNLQGQPLGIYDVILSKADTAIATLANGFSVVNANNGGGNTGGGVNTGSGNGNEPGCDPGAAGGLNSLLVTELVVPDKVFAGWPFVIQVHYSNPTNVDMPAPTRILYSERDIRMALTPSGVDNGTTALYLELTEPGGPPGIIRAGASGTILVYAKAPMSVPAHTHVLFNLK